MDNENQNDDYSSSSSSSRTSRVISSHPISVTPIPKKLANILQNLRYIAGVPSGHKLNLTTRSYDDASSWVDSSKRTLWYTSESKEGAVKMVEECTDEAIDAINEYRRSSYYSILINDIQECSKGIKRLIDMYKDSPDTVNSLSLRLDDIKVALSQEGVSCSPPKSNSSKQRLPTDINVMVAGPNAGKSGDGSIVYHGA